MRFSFATTGVALAVLLLCLHCATADGAAAVASSSAESSADASSSSGSSVCDAVANTTITRWDPRLHLIVRHDSPFVLDEFVRDFAPLVCIDPAKLYAQKRSTSIGGRITTIVLILGRCPRHPESERDCVLKPFSYISAEYSAKNTIALSLGVVLASVSGRVTPPGPSVTLLPTTTPTSPVTPSRARTPSPSQSLNVTKPPTRTASVTSTPAATRTPTASMSPSSKPSQSFTASESLMNGPPGTLTPTIATSIPSSLSRTTDVTATAATQTPTAAPPTPVPELPQCQAIRATVLPRTYEEPALELWTTAGNPLGPSWHVAIASALCLESTDFFIEVHRGSRASPMADRSDQQLVAPPVHHSQVSEDRDARQDVPILAMPTPKRVFLKPSSSCSGGGQCVAKSFFYAQAFFKTNKKLPTGADSSFSLGVTSATFVYKGSPKATPGAASGSPGPSSDTARTVIIAVVPVSAFGVLCVGAGFLAFYFIKGRSDRQRADAANAAAVHRVPSNSPHGFIAQGMEVEMGHPPSPSEPDHHAAGPHNHTIVTFPPHMEQSGAHQKQHYAQRATWQQGADLSADVKTYPTYAGGSSSSSVHDPNAVPKKSIAQ